MSEKTTLLPTAPADERFVDETSRPSPNPQTAIPMPRIVIVPGLEFDPSRKYRYGVHALIASGLIFLAFILIETRYCNWGPGIDLDQLQALHISMMIFTFVLYLLSLFGIADFIFQFKLFFLVGVLIIYTFVGLMVWMTYEAAVSPCVAISSAIPISTSPPSNVFSQGDAVGIIVLILDIFATILMVSAAGSFYKRY